MHIPYTPITDRDIRIGSFVRIQCRDEMIFVNSEMEQLSGYWFRIARRLETAPSGQGRYDLEYEPNYNKFLPPIPTNVRTVGWIWRAYMFDSIMHTPPTLSASLLGKGLLPDI